MSPDERMSALQAMLERARETAAERGIQLPKDLPPRSQRVKGFSEQVADAEVILVREATAEATADAAAAATNDDEEDLIDLGPPTTAEPDVSRLEHGGSEPQPARIKLTAFAESPAVDTTSVSSVPPHVAIAAAAAAAGQLVRFGGGFGDEEVATGDVDAIEARMLAEADAAERGRVAVVTESGQDDEEDDSLATLPPKARDGSSLPPARASRNSPPLKLEDLDEELGAPPPPRSVSATGTMELQAPAYVPPPAYVAPPALVEPSPPAYVAPAPVQVEPPAEIDAIELDEADVLPSAPPEGADFFAPEEVLEEAERAATPAPPLMASPVTEEEPAPASQRQPREPERPIDDALDGVESNEPAPESGEVESQRVPAHAAIAARALDPYGGRESTVDALEAGLLPDSDPPESVTPAPAVDVTAEVRSLGSVEVVERSDVLQGVVPEVIRDRRRAQSSFGELLDDALALGESPPSIR